MLLNELRDWNGGTLPAHVDGGYPVLYLSAAGAVLCAECANKDDTSDPAQAADVFYEGATQSCEDCGCNIESAYGDPDEPAEEEAEEDE